MMGGRAVLPSAAEPSSTLRVPRNRGSNAMNQPSRDHTRTAAPQTQASMVPVLAALLIGLLVGFTGGRLSRPGAQPTGVPSVANGAAESAHAAALADLRSKLAAATEQANSLQRLLDLYQRGERAKAPEPPVQAGPSLEETL